jgi:hypothetical protein
MLPFSVPVIFTFEIKSVLILKKNSGAKWLRPWKRVLMPLNQQLKKISKCNMPLISFAPQVWG